MRRMICSMLLALAVFASDVQADARKTLGWGRLFTNDFLGDGDDRWRTGSYAVSLLRGRIWEGRAPDRIGSLLEYRFRSEIIAPANITAPDSNDRRYVGVLSLGLHSHFTRGDYDIAAGVDLVVVGQQTGLDEFQGQLHELLGFPTPNISGFQVADAVYPTALAEVSRDISLGTHRQFRPFLELQAGAETLARVGADLTIGSFGENGLMLRDLSSGQLFLGVPGTRQQGTSFVVGGDAALVADSRYLATPGIETETSRYRLRAGIHQKWQAGSAFFGVTYLSPEFESQSEGQFIGSINLRFPF